MKPVSSAFGAVLRSCYAFDSSFRFVSQSEASAHSQGDACAQESQATPAGKLRGVVKKGGGGRRGGGGDGKGGGKRDSDGSPPGEGAVAIMNLVA